MDPPPRLHRNRDELIPLPLHKFQPIPNLLGSPEVRGMAGSARSQVHHVRLRRQASDEVNEYIAPTNMYSVLGRKRAYLGREACNVMHVT